ncbi:MAG: protease pro-enzyme activation domain-containing protein [Bryobacteraceae bacterium]
MDRFTRGFLLLIFCSLSITSTAYSQRFSPLRIHPVDRVRASVDDGRRVLLPGNRHPLARPELEAGAVEQETPMERMILVLRADDSQEQALQALIAAQHEPRSALYHQWITPSVFGEHFGVSQHDLDQVVNWLGAHQFRIDEIPAGSRSIIFSGSAASVEAAFHTTIRRYRIGTEMHTANATDPEIPAALSGVVAGVATLHDFHSKAMHRSVRPLTTAQGHSTPQYTSGSYHYLAPADFATIYNVAPLYAGGVDGSGQKLAIVARSNIKMSDVQYFRSTMGLPANNPTVVLNGPDPGVVGGGEEDEADLDVQWSGAVAPKATVLFVVSKSTSSTDGVDLSAQYIVSNNLAPVMSTSFGLCEASTGATKMAFYNNLWQQAATQGITSMISSGDSGAAGCDGGSASSATHGLGVNGLCSSPYSVCVGGTEFNEGSNASQYWSSSSASNWASALSYIPEVAWNESGINGGSGLWSTGGGASIYYSKPAWQTGVGVPQDGKRDVPDVSLTAASHDGYLVAIEGGLYVIGGTSASSPSFAGLMALVNQQTGSAQGNANTTFYGLANLQYAGGLTYFHDITAGNNSVPGLTGFSAGTGYDLATGLGSVDATTLVNHWMDATAPTLTLTASPSSATLSLGSSGSVSVRVADTNSSATSVALSVSGAPAGVTATFGSSSVPAPGSNNTTLNLTANASVVPGTYTLTLNATDGTLSQSSTLSLTISSSGCTLTSSVSSMNVNVGASSTAQITCPPVNGFNTSLKLTVTGGPQGTVTFSPTSISGTAKSTLTVKPTTTAAAGTYTLSVTAAGGSFSQSISIPLTINDLTLSLSSSKLTLTPGSSSQITVTTAHAGGFQSSVALSITGLPTGATGVFTPSTIASPGDGTSTLALQTGATTAGGTYTLTVKAVGGGITRTQTLSLAVPGFTLTASPTSLSVGQGASGTVTFTVGSVAGGFSSPVAFSILSADGSAVPSTITPAFNPSSLAAPGSGKSILTLALAANTTLASYSLSVTASGGGVTRSVTIKLTATPPPSFTLKASPTSLNLVTGGSLTSTITSTAAYGFSSNVALSAGTLPSGVTASFQSTSIAGNAGHTVLTLQASGATPGSYTVTITGVGGGVTATVPITLNVSTVTMTVAPASLTISHPSTASVAVTTSVSGPYASTVTLAVSGLPKGVTASFSPSSITNAAIGASTLKLTSTTSAVAGTSTITVKGTCGGATLTSTFTLIVQ